MEFLAIVGLIAAVAHLWRRLDKAEAKLAELEWRPAEAVCSPPIPEQPLPARSTSDLWAPEPPPTPAAAAQARPAEPEIHELVPSWPVAAGDDERLVEEPAVPRAGYLPKLTFDFEDIFGRRLPIWAGGITLALAGIFLVRFSIEAGLLTPTIRVLLGFLFGAALLAAAEAAYRFEDRVRDPRVRQALAGAGLATLYASFYLAGSQYGLIGSGAAFLGLGAVTAAAIALSFRFGMPSAVLGLVGGFAAPALVASEDGNVPLLTLYLVLITAALAFTGRRQQRPWLSYVALAGALVWGALLLAAGLADTTEILAFGLYVAVLGAVLPLIAGGEGRWAGARMIAAGLASLQLAALIHLAGQQLLTWGLYLLLAGALAVLGWRDARLRPASAFAAAVALVLLALWTSPGAGEFWPVAGGIAAVFVAAPLALVLTGRGDWLDVRQLSLAAPALAAVAYWQFGEWDSPGAEPLLAAVAFGLAAAPALAARRAWNAGSEGPDLLLPLTSAAALTLAAFAMLVPAWATPFAGSALALALAELLRRRPGTPVRGLVWAFAMVVLGLLFTTPQVSIEAPRLAGYVTDGQGLRAAARWLAAALPFAALAWIEARRPDRHTAEALAAAFVYGAAAQLVPADWLAWTAALGAVAVCGAWRGRAGAWGALIAIAALWAWAPLMEWLSAGALALGGQPVLAEALPDPRAVLLRLAPVVTALTFAAWRLRDEPRPFHWLAAAAAVVGAVVLHILYKQVFGLASAEDFVRLGMAERTVWQGLLTTAGLLALWRLPERGGRITGIGLVAASLAHFAWFTLLLHNPLWEPQEVGPWPVASWLLAAYGLAAIGLVTLERLARSLSGWLPLVPEAALMALIAIYALSELRHVHSGTLLTASAMTQGEDLMRSLLGIVLALLYLAWGSRTGRRSWRIGSLVLMVLAVGKVFLVDAAGLEGLLRIASFMALGFSLIGIGWVYSRQLRARPAPAAE